MDVVNWLHCVCIFPINSISIDYGNTNGCVCGMLIGN